MAVTYLGGVGGEPATSGWTVALADEDGDTVELPPPAANKARQLNVKTVGEADNVVLSTPEGLILGPHGLEAATLELGPSKAYTAVTTAAGDTDWHVI